MPARPKGRALRARMRRVLTLFLSMFLARRAEEDIVREMASHLAMLEDEHRRRGLAPDDAALAARRAMGSLALAKDRHRDARSFVWIEDLRRDFRHAVRSLH